jgi:endonuclease YncB( thermonuclease family)
LQPEHDSDRLLDIEPEKVVENVMMSLPRIVQGYASLYKQVEETLLLGRREIEKAKVHAYWRTGKLIADHIQRYGTREERYGNQVIEKLSNDLEMSASVLWRCLRFAQTFEILATWQESPHLSWSHFRELITVPDKETRLSLMRRAEKAEWSVLELAQKIQREAPRDFSNGESPVTHPFKLNPKKGVLYTYRLAAPDSAHKEEDADRLWIDLGFQVHRQMPENAKDFREGSLIESKWDKESGYSVHSTKQTEADLFTYKAFVERVVDGDTLIVKIDLGFETRIREYLRLRGLDAPEMDTAKGKRAREFVAKELGKVDHVILKSSRSDKYGRYLADIFYGPEDGQYLNQRLLDEGYAESYS